MTSRCLVLDLGGPSHELLAEIDAVAGIAAADAEAPGRSVGWLDELTRNRVLGLLTDRSGDPVPASLANVASFTLSSDLLAPGGLENRVFAMAAAAAGCFPNELVAIGGDVARLEAAQATGCRAVHLEPTGRGRSGLSRFDARIDSFEELVGALRRLDADVLRSKETVGVGPHPRPWPQGAHLDPELLRDGDRRNVVDRYRYWSEEAIIADLAARRHGFQVAVENWRHDRNIGAVVRNANAFGSSAVHIVGHRRWNRRGAMATDRYLEVRHHASTDAFVGWCRSEHLPIVAIDNVTGSSAIENAELPERCVMVFGQEGPGLSVHVLEQADMVCGITQYGSTRSMNAGVASGIAMYAWALRHADPRPGWLPPSEGT